MQLLLQGLLMVHVKFDRIPMLGFLLVNGYKKEQNLCVSCGAAVPGL
jgi:hypothetical protein